MPMPTVSGANDTNWSGVLPARLALLQVRRMKGNVVLVGGLQLALRGLRPKAGSGVYIDRKGVKRRTSLSARLRSELCARLTRGGVDPNAATAWSSLTRR